MSADLSFRQQLAQGLRDFIQGRGGWVTSPLPLEDIDGLRFEVPSHEASDVTGVLARLGLAVRFVTAGLQIKPAAVVELTRDGHNIVGTRRSAGSLAVTTFEIRLPGDRPCPGH